MGDAGDGGAKKGAGRGAARPPLGRTEAPEGALTGVAVPAVKAVAAAAITAERDPAAAGVDAATAAAAGAGATAAAAAIGVAADAADAVGRVAAVVVAVRKGGAAAERGVA